MTITILANRVSFNIVQIMTFSSKGSLTQVQSHELEALYNEITSDYVNNVHGEATWTF